MHIRAEHQGIVIAAINRHVPADVEVYFFGSRVNGTAKEASDLDVLLKGRSPVALDAISCLREELEESDLPFKVDLLDYHHCSKNMIHNISAELVRIPRA